MKTLLHLQDLQKSFGQQLVLNHVGFELQSERMEKAKMFE